MCKRTRSFLLVGGAKMPTDNLPVPDLDAIHHAYSTSLNARFRLSDYTIQLQAQQEEDAPPFPCEARERVIYLPPAPESMWVDVQWSSGITKVMYIPEGARLILDRMGSHFKVTQRVR